MGIGFVILIYLVIIFIISIICAVTGSVITYFVSKKEDKKRKTILVFIAPFVFFYTFYICWIIGTSVVSENKKVDMGIGDAWYVPLKNNHQLLFIDLPEQAYIAKENGTTLVSDVAEIKENGHQIFGKTDNKKYFVFDTQTDEVRNFDTEKELTALYAGEKIDLVDAYDFYLAKKDEIMGYSLVLIGLLSFIISMGAVYIWKHIIFFSFGKPAQIV